MILSNIKPLYYFIDVKEFTNNSIYKINSLLINNPVISQIYESMYYGETTFDNHKHDNWNIQLTNIFNSNINTIVIKLKEDLKNNPQNNKFLVIFQNLTKSQNSYGCFWINSENKVRSMHVSIDYIVEDLLQTIIKDIHLWPKVKLYDAILDRKNKHNAIEIENIYKEYIETYRCSDYNKWKDMSRKFNARYRI